VYKFSYSRELQTIDTATENISVCELTDHDTSQLLICALEVPLLENSHRSIVS